MTEILDLIKDYYSKDGNGTGGNLHITLDDWNLEDSNIKFCIKLSEKNKDKDGINIGNKLLALSKIRREKILSEFWQYWSNE